MTGYIPGPALRQSDLPPHALIGRVRVNVGGLWPSIPQTSWEDSDDEKRPKKSVRVAKRKAVKRPRYTSKVQRSYVPPRMAYAREPYPRARSQCEATYWVVGVASP